MPAKQYQFVPPKTDPRATSEQQWSDMLDELNVTRDQLESANAQCTSQAALIDMLRKELSDAKSAGAIIERSNIVMRTKLQAAGMLVLDALKTDELERGAAVSEFAVKTPQSSMTTVEEKPLFLKAVVPPQNEMS